MHTHKILNVATANQTLCNTFARELGISKILAQILINRSIHSVKEAEDFLKADVRGLLDPYSFSDMPGAVGLVRKAASNKEKVLLFGDYDVDGITAVALLKNSLSKCGIKAQHYLPHRIKEGYGLNENVLRVARQKGVNLLITADCGISNHSQIKELRQHNIDVIVTDHHEPQDEYLPPASSILNPKTKDSNYKYRDLAGVGVAYKFCQAVTDSMLLEDLDLVSLGTIADSVPLTGENRVIAREGLSRLSRTSRLGLRALIENAGIQNKKFNSTYVSFILGPRINASGRLDSAEVSLDLLMSDDPDEANRLAAVVETHNRQRQKIEGKVLEEAEALINKEINFKDEKVIVIAKEDWHQGVLGIVASKLADRFYRPAIVISLTQNLCRGSGRSIKNFHLFEALGQCRQFLSAFGGHDHAAGLVITRQSINDFRRNINRLASEKLSLEDLLPGLDVDMEVNFRDFDEKTIAEFEALEPFGAGNPEPLLYSRGLRLKGQPQVLSRETIKFWVTDGDITYQAIGFGMSAFRGSLINADSFDMVYTPRLDTWQDDTSIILEVEDIFFR